jgi:hypothetical protein
MTTGDIDLTDQTLMRRDRMFARGRNDSAPLRSSL